MKKFFSFLSKFYVHPITVILLALALFSGRFKPLFLFLLATLVHEFGHVIMAALMKVKINRIVVLPFGFFAEMEDLNQIPILKEFLVVIAGPLTFFINQIIFAALLKNGFISFHAYNQALVANKTILLFNLLPIYPLDGGRLLALIISCFLPMKKCFYSLSIISYITIIVLVFYNLGNIQVLLIGYLIVNQFDFILTLHPRWIRFLIGRTNKDPAGKMKIHHQEDIYRPYENYIFYDNKLYSEKTFIPLLMSKKRRNTN